jgi:glycosyltransferase involved in cell wall biosynthesis
MKKKIFVKAPCLSQSGYGEQSRFALRALRSQEDYFDIYVQPIPWGKTGWIWEDDEFRHWLDERIIITQQALQNKSLSIDMSLQITIPNEFEKIAPVNIGYTAGIETSAVSPIWLQKGNEEVNKILVVSSHAKTVYENTTALAKNNQTGEEFPYKLETPVAVVWENTQRHEPEEIPGFEPHCDFNFLVVSQMGPRKNFQKTITWFVEEFIDQEVGLIIKTNGRGNSRIDLEATEAALKGVLTAYPDRKCKVSLLHGDLSGGQMTALYTHPKVKCMINIAHGEGFGLPLFEAAREGLPIVTIGWSGQLDFLHHDGKNYYTKVNWSLRPIQKEAVWEGVLEANSQWAFADQGSYKMSLRKVYKSWDQAKETAEKLKLLVKEKFSDERLYALFCSELGAPKREKVDYVFVSDMFKEQYTGGAELSLDVIIESCKGTKTKINSSDLTKDLIDINKESTWVFGNIAHLEDEVIKYFFENNIKYYFVEFDYKFCEYRNPKLYEFLEDEKCDYKETYKGKLITDFINSSLKTFFMSEEQKNIFLENLKIDNDRLFVLSSIFDSGFFEKIKELKSTNKNNKWLVLGSRSWVKGSSESEQWCKNNNLEYEVVSDLPYEKMLEKLAESKGVCFKPTGLDTCPRFVIEAKLLGCELELNENVQHTRESWFDTNDMSSIVEYLKKRKEVFWELVGENE